jgi:hypothetical protein
VVIKKGLQARIDDQVFQRTRTGDSGAQLGVFSFLVPAGCYSLESNGSIPAGGGNTNSSQPGSVLFAVARKDACAVARKTVSGFVLALSPLLPAVSGSQLASMRVVLTWGPENGQSISDLDLQMTFTTSEDKCQVAYFREQCDNAALVLDNPGGISLRAGAETIKVDTVKKTIYHFFVTQYVGSSAVSNPFSGTQAQVDVYASGVSWPIASFPLPAVDAHGTGVENADRAWSVFCIDGSRGVAGVQALNLFGRKAWLNVLTACAAPVTGGGN